MRILEIHQEPIDHISYDVVAPRAWSQSEPRNVIRTQFPILYGLVDELPEDIDALVVASDLQGHIDEDLMGLAFPELLEICLGSCLEDYDAQRVGVILGGDLFSLPNKRGGLGEVREVWRAFRDQFRWVAGVLGNHDQIGFHNRDVPSFQHERGISLLDGSFARLDGLHVAGVSGVIGTSGKLNRRSASSYCSILERVLRKVPDILILHETPDSPFDDFPGKSVIRDELERGGRTLVCCGHRHWPEPLRELHNGTQILNCEGRAVILRAKRETA
ncbi:MAG: metallophosphoesterase [Myxococcales bacterium]|nr:metallophosphoesterase [Myxococcales bacterium]MCB9643465.1 metallophosphoesterase [Myxococcales bacterium]